MNIGYIFTHKMLCQTHDLCSEVIQYTSNTYKVSNRDKSLLLWFLNFKILPFKIKALPTLIVKHGHNNIKWTFCLMLIFQYNGIQESEDMSEYRRKKKLPTCNLRSSRHYSMSLVRNKWRIQETPVFCTLAAVYSRLLATWAMGDIHFQRNHEMALKWSLKLWCRNHISRGVAPFWCLSEHSGFRSGGSVFGLMKGPFPNQNATSRSL